MLRGFLPDAPMVSAGRHDARTVTVQDIVPIPDTSFTCRSVESNSRTAIPIDYVSRSRMVKRRRRAAGRRADSTTRFSRGSRRAMETGMLYGALWNPAFAKPFSTDSRGASGCRAEGRIVGFARSAFRQIWGGRGATANVAPSAAEQSNSSIIFGDKFLLKLFRKVESGSQPGYRDHSFLVMRASRTTPAVGRSHRVPAGRRRANTSRHSAGPCAEPRRRVESHGRCAESGTSNERSHQQIPSSAPGAQQHPPAR